MKADRVMSRLREARNGKANDSELGRRLTGTGSYAEMIGRRFNLACQRLKLGGHAPGLDTSRFTPPPPPSGTQLKLF